MSEQKERFRAAIQAFRDRKNGVTPPVEDRPIQAGDWVGPHPIEAADPRDSWPPCRDCGGSVHPGASGPGGVCSKCAANAKPDPYTAHRLAVVPDGMRFLEPSDAALKARARNEAALRREAERPRGNRADAIEFAKAHPWEEFE